MHAGRSQLDPIAGALAERLCAWGVEAHVHRALEVRHIRTKSVQTASARGRRERVTGHIRCRNGVRLPAGMPVIVIDDIVTSGATMRECIDVLRAQGNPVLAALALAHTPPRAPEQS
nr:phosphoribosyltransferase family protein [Bifidobacterium pseudolongum]